MDEKFICIGDDFNEKPEGKTRGAVYESENFVVTISYSGSYFKDKNANIFDKHSICFVVKPKTPNTCFTVGYNCHNSPYEEDVFFSWNDSSAVPKQIDSGNYEKIMNAYHEAFTRAREAADEILPKYFPKDAKFI